MLIYNSKSHQLKAMKILLNLNLKDNQNLI